jgi:hypothetical protein
VPEARSIPPCSRVEMVRAQFWPLDGHMSAPSTPRAAARPAYEAAATVPLRTSQDGVVVASSGRPCHPRRGPAAGDCRRRGIRARGAQS